MPPCYPATCHIAPLPPCHTCPPFHARQPCPACPALLQCWAPTLGQAEAAGVTSDLYLQAKERLATLTERERGRAQTALAEALEWGMDPEELKALIER